MSLIIMVIPQKATPFTGTTLSTTYKSCAGGLSTVCMVIDRHCVRFSLSVENNKQDEAVRDGQTHLARPNYQAQTGTDRKIFIFSVQLTTSRILGKFTRSIHTLL